MMANDEIPPSRFVGLHSHSTFSTFDGLGYPNEIIDFVIENGMDAVALTDHGHCNGWAYGDQHAKKLNSSGKPFKFIGGVEAYYHPDLSAWREDYEIAKQARLDAKALKKRMVDEAQIDGAEDAESMTIENEAESRLGSLLPEDKPLMVAHASHDGAISTASSLDHIAHVSSSGTLAAPDGSAPSVKDAAPATTSSATNLPTTRANFYIGCTDADDGPAHESETATAPASPINRPATAVCAQESLKESVSCANTWANE